MKETSNIKDQIKTAKIVAVIRGEMQSEAMAKAEAAIAGGIKVVEITFTVPGAEHVIFLLNMKYGDKVLIGAGTVLDRETVKMAASSGAKFVVSPSYVDEVADECKKQGIFYVPGVYTPTEVTNALKAGFTMLKLFPADIKLLKALKGPFPDAEFMTTGGVSLDNLNDWFKAGAAAVGAGSNLTSILDCGGTEAACAAEIKKWTTALK